MSALALVLVGAPGLAAPPDATPDAAKSPRTPPSRMECLTAHRSVQELRNTGRLVEAGQKVLVCSSDSCPGPVVADCAQWLNELDQATPSLVFEIQADGKAAPGAKVFVDGVQMADWSHSVKVDPGSHDIRVELAPFPAHEEKLLMAEGHRMRLVSIDLSPAKPAPGPETPGQPAGPAQPGPSPVPDVPEKRPVPVVVYPLLGIGVAGLVGFGVFGGLGRAKQSDLEKNCSPNCTNSDLSPMKTDYLIGDVSLGVGAAALVGAAIVYLTRPGEKPQAASLTSLQLEPIGSPTRHNAGWMASATMSF